MLTVEPGPISAAQCELTTPRLAPLTPFTREASTLTRNADGSVVTIDHAKLDATCRDEEAELLAQYVPRSVARMALEEDDWLLEEAAAEPTAADSSVA